VPTVICGENLTECRLFAFALSIYLLTCNHILVNVAAGQLLRSPLPQHAVALGCVGIAFSPRAAYIDRPVPHKGSRVQGPLK